MRSVTFTVTSNFPLSDSELIEELLLAETRMNTESKLRFHVQNCPSKTEELENKVEAYRFVCRVAGIPQFIIDNPEAIHPEPLTNEDIKWAKKKIEEYKLK